MRHIPTDEIEEDEAASPPARSERRSAPTSDPRRRSDSGRSSRPTSPWSDRANSSPASKRVSSGLQGVVRSGYVDPPPQTKRIGSPAAIGAVIALCLALGGGFLVGMHRSVAPASPSKPNAAQKSANQGLIGGLDDAVLDAKTQQAVKAQAAREATTSPLPGLPASGQPSPVPPPPGEAAQQAAQASFMAAQQATRALENQIASRREDIVRLQDELSGGKNQTQLLQARVDRLTSQLRAALTDHLAAKVSVQQVQVAVLQARVNQETTAAPPPGADAAKQIADLDARIEALKRKRQDDNAAVQAASARFKEVSGTVDISESGNAIRYGASANLTNAVKAQSTDNNEYDSLVNRRDVLSATAQPVPAAQSAAPEMAAAQAILNDLQQRQSAAANAAGGDLIGLARQAGTPRDVARLASELAQAQWARDAGPSKHVDTAQVTAELNAEQAALTQLVQHYQQARSTRQTRQAQGQP